MSETEPLKISEHWRDRRRSKTLRLSLAEYNGHSYADLREFFTDREGCMKPSKKGVTIPLRLLATLRDDLNRAIAKAGELGLLKMEIAE